MPAEIPDLTDLPVRVRFFQCGQLTISFWDEAEGQGTNS